VAQASAVWAQSKEADRLREATTVLHEIMAAPDRAIPRSVLEQAEGIAVFPSTLKAGLAASAAEASSACGIDRMVNGRHQRSSR
jgi:lipid-binding SYLF domain-containing protein